MATGFFYKTSDDVGAPDLTNVAGSLIAVLDWILDVAGGTHWEKVFTGTNKAVYRATAGERYYFRVDDTLGQVARFQAYETMSDVDTGTNQWPGTGSAYGYLAFPKSDVAQPTFYRAVGDSRFFMLINNYDPTYAWLHQMMGFGETNPFDSLDSYSTVVMGSNHNATAASWNNWTTHGWVGYPSRLGSNSGVIFANQAMIYSANNPDGLSPAGSGGDVIETSFNTENLNFQYNDQGAVPIFPVIHSSGSGQSSGDTTRKILRGRIPYWYASPLQIEAGGMSHLDEITVGPETYLVIGRGSSSTSSFANDRPALIRITDNEPGRA